MVRNYKSGNIKVAIHLFENLRIFLRYSQMIASDWVKVSQTRILSKKDVAILNYFLQTKINGISLKGSDFSTPRKYIIESECFLFVWIV